MPINLGNPSIKMNRIFCQADEWIKKYISLIKRCGIESPYIPSGVEMPLGSIVPVKIAELNTAVADAESNLSVDLDELIQMKELGKKAQIWIEKASSIAPKRNVRKKKRATNAKEEKHSIQEISKLINEASTISLDISDELERLKIEQSVTLSWRLQAQCTIRDIISAFDDFRKERAAMCSCRWESSKSSDEVPQNPNAGVGQKSDPVNDESESLSQRKWKHTPSRSDSFATDNTVNSGSATPTSLESGEKNVFLLVSHFIRSAKSLNTLTPEGKIADELNDVMSWFTKTYKLMNSSSDIFDRKFLFKLDKLIESGQELLKYDGVDVDESPEDSKLIEDLRQSWASAIKDDIDRLLDLQNRRSEFLEWCEKADEIISSTDKKVSIELLKELGTQSAAYPPCKNNKMRV